MRARDGEAIIPRTYFSIPKTARIKRLGPTVNGSAAEDYRLDFGANFYLNRSVSAAEDEVSSLTAVSSAAAGQHAAGSFTTTHWSVVLEAQGETPAAQRALEI